MLKPELQVKFLNHLNRRNKKDEGFTLIELLVVVIIIGVLAAIALPSLLGQVNKAKQSEAKQNVGATNRAQQAFYLEYQNFATSIPALQIGIRTQSDNYSYVINPTASNGSFAQVKAFARERTLKSYYGITYTALGDTATSEALTLALACESLAPTQSVLNITSYADATSCNNSFTSLAR